MIRIDDIEEFESRVLEAYQNAFDDDWFPEDYTSRDVALDMLAFDATLEEYFVEPSQDTDDDEMIDLLTPIIQKVHFNV